MLNLLLAINNIICGFESELRSSDYIGIIEDAFISCQNSTNTNNEYIKECLKCASLIKLLQPFIDGNHRTGLIVFYLLLKNKGYHFDIESALKDMASGKLNLPTLYDINDSVNNIEEFKSYIKYAKKIC